MTCPYVVDLPGCKLLKGCKQRPQRVGVKHQLVYSSCSPECYNGPYERCPWYNKP